MHRELRAALERVGWNELYERHIVGISNTNSRGERSAVAPFPDSLDTNPSFYFNIYEGLWHCKSSDRGGNYVTFRAILEATEFDEQGRAIPDYEATERRLLIEFGVVNPIDPAWVQRCRVRLYQDESLHLAIQQYKPWDPRVLYTLGVGYDDYSERFSIPCYDRAGTLVNCRMYRPAGDPKILWKVAYLTANLLYPVRAWQERILLLVEGETDVNSLRSLGFAGCSGTFGKDGLVPPGGWWVGKDIYILGDVGELAERAVVEAGRLTVRDSNSTRICTLPAFPGRRQNSDISDYIQWMRSEGWSFEVQQRAIVDILNESRLVDSPHAVFDQAPTQVSFQEALASQHIGRRLSFNARVAARSSRRFILPVTYNVTCPASGHPYCRRCPMQGTFQGNAHFTHDPRAPETLKLIQGTDREQLEAIKRMHGIASQCPDVNFIVQRSTDVEPVMLNAALTQSETEENRRVEQVTREAMVLVSDTALDENRDFEFEGFIYPHPKTQHGLFLIDKARPLLKTFDKFELTDPLMESLKIFRPVRGQNVIAKLEDIVVDLSDSITLIRDRVDLHLLYRSVWHSALAFTFAGAVIRRGWIEALVVGDTRCGKSVTFRKLAEHYGIGLLVDCKAQSPAGILGSVVQSQTTGERYVAPGILPQQDDRVVCFDEFAVSRWSGQQSLVEVLSSTRSEGVVRISKAASATFRARVRAIWLGNPGMGRLMSELGVSGVEVIPRLIGQPEDIARFDMALTVSQRDVSYDAINRVGQPTKPRYPPDVARALLAWIYSRRSDQIWFTPDAQYAVMDQAKAMYDKYDASIPLVEPADQRVRIAKLSVSIAGQCYSSNDKGIDLIVGPEHVDAAHQLLTRWYDAPSMGYNTYSIKSREGRELTNLPAILELFAATLTNGPQVANQLMELDQFNERTFGTLIPGSISTKQILQLLYSNRCVRLIDHGRRGDAYELTPSFTQWLKSYLRGDM